MHLNVFFEAATKPEIFDFSDNDIFLRPSDDDEQYIDYVKECSGDFKSRWYASISNVPEEQDDSDDNEDDSESSGVKLTTCDGNVEEKFIASQNVSSVTSRLNEMRLPHIRYYTNITGATEAMMDSCREFGGTGDLKVADVESSRDATLSGPQATLGLGIQVSQAVTSESYAACVEQQIEDTINVSNAVAIATEMGSPLVLTPDWASKDTISIDGHRTAADEITGIDTKLLVKKQTISGFSCDATVSRPLLQQSTDDRRSSNSSAEETLEIVAAQIFSGTLRLPNSTKKPVQVHRQNSAMSQSSTKIISFDSPQRSVPIVESGQVILINVDISDCHSMASPILQLEGKQLTEQMQMKKITAVPECELKKNGLSDTGNILPVESVNESATAVISAGQPTKQGNRLMDVLNIGAIPAPPNQSRASSRPHPKRDMPFLSSSLSPTTNVMQCIEHNIQKLCDQEVSHDTSSQCPDGDKFNLSKLNNVEFIFPDSATGDGSIASNPVSMCDSTQTAFAKHVEKLTAERLCSPLVPELGQHVAPVATTPRPSSTIFDFRPATAASSTSPNLKNRVHRNLSESGKRSIAIVGDMQCTDTTDGPDLSAAFFAAGSSLGVPVTRSVPARKSSINSTSLAKPARLQTKWSHVKGAAHNLLHNSKELGSPIVSQSFKINSTATADVEEVCLLPNSDLKNKEVSDSVNAQDINEIKRDTAPLQDTEVEIPFNIHSSGHFCVEATRLSAAVQSMSVNPSNAILKSFSRIACESKVTKAILPSVCVDFDDEIFDNESNECNHLNIMRYARCTQDISPRISESHYRYCAELDGVSQQPLEKITSLDSTDAIIRVVVKDSKSPQLSFRPGKNNNQLNSELSVDYPLDPSDRPINGSIAEPATALEGQGSNNLPHVNFSMTTDTLHRTFGSKPSVYAVSDPTKEEQRHVSSKNQKQATRIRLALKNSL